MKERIFCSSRSAFFTQELQGFGSVPDGSTGYNPQFILPVI